MMDYHILSMDSVGGKVTDHGVALHIKDVPWAGRQMWAPDAAFANNTYYLYFPVKNKKDVFQIGVATSDKPEGPLKLRKNLSKEVTVLILPFSKMMMVPFICTSVVSGAGNCKDGTTTNTMTLLKIVNRRNGCSTTHGKIE